MTKSELIDRLCMRYPQLRSQDVEEAVKLIIEQAEHLAAEEG